ncbi:MAG TPA: hypothetical protein VGH03_20935 [Caulobacteraceae bacterium]|jgi:hypothetical protein
MRTLIVVFALAFAAHAAEAKSCKDPKTGQFVKCPASAAAPAAAPEAAPSATAASSAGKPTAATTSTSGGAPHCKTGKPCGNSCIAQNKVCHK